MNPTSMRNKVKYGVFDRKTMRNTSVLFYFSYIIYLIINKLSRKYENMRNEFDKFGSSSNLVVI